MDGDTTAERSDVFIGFKCVPVSHASLHSFFQSYKYVKHVCEYQQLFSFCLLLRFSFFHSIACAFYFYAKWKLPLLLTIASPILFYLSSVSLRPAACVPHNLLSRMITKTRACAQCMLLCRKIYSCVQIIAVFFNDVFLLHFLNTVRAFIKKNH